MSKHILIVEDEKDLLNTLEYNFKKEGYLVTSASTGKKALEEIGGKSKPNLVILDLMLPDISGLEICKEIRNNLKNEHILILMLKKVMSCFR